LICIPETSTRNPVNWKLLDWYYNGIIYPSSSDLRAALKSPGFQKAPLNLDGNWTDTEDFDSQPPGRELPPPVMVQPKGNRFRLDNEQRFVSWMGFEFFIGTSSATGVALHDISFNGDSVIHELSLQEALAHYAGDDPSQGGLEFLDSFIGIGSKMFELVPGYDCPSYATFLPSTFYIDGSTLINKNSICIFEYTADHALQRHTSAFQVTISRNTYLVVRSVSTVGNYDYTIDYIFYLDGSIEVKFRASGFIFGAFWTPSREKAEDGYGYRVQAAVTTSMHDHVLNFKADLDIAGSVNTFKRVAIEPVTLEYPWDDERTTPRNTMHLVERTVEREVGLDWPRNSGEMYIVMNENAINSWGEKRGYRIAPGTGMGTPSHLTVLNSTTFEKSANWASSDLWLVNQKDTEPRSASPLNYISPGNPLVDFSKMVNGEDVVQQDL
jgi:primary-amine oxidase